MQYIFVTGGVCSALGKGLTASSIGLLLERQGLKIAMMKIDPYLNVDAGTMSPYIHGEVYVTDDGAETDLDLGHYYRFTNSPLSKRSIATCGDVYGTVIQRERQGDCFGQNIQVIPHITDEIKQRILACGEQDTDIVVVEVGGTVGDIEGLPVYEAIRQFRGERPTDCLNLHLTYVPYLKSAGEIKTKPTQHSVQALRQIGIIPDIILCRSERRLEKEIREKIALFCSVDPNSVIEAVDTQHTIYELPLRLREQGIDRLICEHLGRSVKQIDLRDWEELVEKVKQPKRMVTVGLVGKYVKHQDADKSIIESLHHAAITHGLELKIKRIEADHLELGGCDGYLLTGGFGERGFLGKVETAKYCRENRIPCFGICFGMQAIVVEFARHVAGLSEANSTEIDPKTPHPVISLIEEEIKQLGGTMRLGAYPCTLSGKVASIYGSSITSERHRHRYEFNPTYGESLEKAGLLISGLWKEGNLAEAVEVQDHPWMIGVQYHPEFRSKPTAPHPLFLSFIEAMIGG